MLENWPYVAVVVGMLVEANITIFAAMFYLATGKFMFWPLLSAVLVGAFLEQVIWYVLGRNLNRFPYLEKKLHRWVKRFDRHFFDKPYRTFILSKFIYGLHRSVLLRFGMLKFKPFWYFRAGSLAIFVWLAVLMPLGYVFGKSYSKLGQYVKYGEVIILVVVVGLFVVEYFVSRKYRDRL